MIAEAGLAMLWLAAALALLQFGLIARSPHDPDNAAAVRALAVAQGFLLVAALLALIALFVRADMTVALVAAHSHSSEPWLERLADSWASVGGGVLLLAAIGGVAGAVAALDLRTRLAVIARWAALVGICDAVLLFGVHPFARLVVEPTGGRGLGDHHPLMTLLPVVLGFALWLAVVLARSFDELAVEKEPTPPTWPFAIASLGAAVLLIGLAAPATFSTERSVAAAVGRPQRIGGFTVTLDGIRPIVGEGWSALEGRLSVRREDDATYLLRPQARYYAAPPTKIGASAVATHFDGQFVAALGERQANGRWRLRLSWRPLAQLTWVGALLILIGGALALLDWWRRARRARDAAVWA